MRPRIPNLKSLVLLTVLLPACTDLAAVREWSSTSMQAAQFNEIVTTYADTPDRIALYDPDEAAFWDEQAEIRGDQAEALNLQLALVAEYMAALAALSADGAADFGKEIGGLTDSLENTGQLDAATLGAAGQLATTIANAAAGAWQRRQVGALIEQANAPLQTLLEGELRSIVDRDFRRDLRIESQFLDRHFEDLLRAPEGSNAAKAALEEWFILRKAENAGRMRAVDAYLRVLDRISEGHQALYDSRDDLDAVALAKDLYKLAKEIRDNVKDIIKA